MDRTVTGNLACSFLAALSIGAMPLAAQRSIPSDSAIRSFMQAAIDSKKAAGLVVGISDSKGHRIFTAGSSGTARPLDDRTIFEIGSFTKVFTGTLLSSMIASGDVALDDPVAKFLPKSVKMPAWNGQQIKLLDLATQSSGLPRLPGNLNPADQADPYADYTTANLYTFLSGYTLPRAPGAKYEYSNLGMGLLGHALALKAGSSYESVLTKRILTPLGLKDTRITLTPDQQARFAVGHGADGSPVKPWALPTLAGAGALRSTANDLLTFVDASLANGSTPMDKVLAGARRIARTGKSGEPDLGLAWHHIHDPAGEIVWHNGATGGFSSYVALDSVAHRGIVVLANTTAPASDDIGIHILMEDRWNAQQAATKRTEVTVPPAILATYVGEYQLTPAFAIVVTLNGASLFAQPTNQPAVELFAQSPTRFFLKVVDAQVEFTSTDGHVTGMILHQNGQDVPGKKIH
jgi:CubicO group peptidase (beta-lactamase class C family)